MLNSLEWQNFKCVCHWHTHCHHQPQLNKILLARVANIVRRYPFYGGFFFMAYAFTISNSVPNWNFEKQFAYETLSLQRHFDKTLNAECWMSVMKYMLIWVNTFTFLHDRDRYEQNNADSLSDAVWCWRNQKSIIIFSHQLTITIIIIIITLHIGLDWKKSKNVLNLISLSILRKIDMQKV